MTKKLKQLINKNWKNGGMKIELETGKLTDAEKEILKKGFRNAMRRIQYERKQSGIDSLPYRYAIKD